MSEISPDRNGHSRARDATSRANIHSQYEELGRRVLAACGGIAIVANWRSRRRDGIVRSPAGSRWHNALNAMLSTAERMFESSAGGISIRFEPAQLLALLGRLGGRENRFDAVAVKRDEGTNQVVVAIVVLHGRVMSEIEAVATLAADRFLEIARAIDGIPERGFWRTRALATSQHLARVTAERTKSQVDSRKLDHAVAVACGLHSRNRFNRLGSIAASLGSFDAWIIATVATAARPDPQVIATFGAIAAIPPLDENSAIADAIRSKSTILRAPNSDSSNRYPEDRIFERFAAYLCVPFGCGAFALAALRPIEPPTIERLEMFAARIAPLVRAWLAETELDRMRRLVRSLGLRMFAAVDTERARIARDLHDDQAQLLAASRIALAAGPEQARDIFKQLERNLHDRVRELRPAMLGRVTLEEALRRELTRLTSVAISGKLIHPERMNTLPRPVQHLCYQIAREAISNVLRHSNATRVEIALEQRDACAVLIVTDNGKGIKDELSNSTGIGLSGLRERLELMGGKLHIASRPGSTTLIAEIPRQA